MGSQYIYLISALTTYHAIGPDVVLNLSSLAGPRSDCASADLRLRKDRILNIRRLINLSGVMQVLRDVVEPGDAEFIVSQR
jgi:hypothetical protein